VKRVPFGKLGLSVGAIVFLLGPTAYGSDEVHWGYSGKGEPENWAKLDGQFMTCGSGKNQSPVNIVNAVEAVLAPIEFQYNDTQLQILNNGHTIQVNYGQGSHIAIDGKTFDLLQFHFHSPSENQIDGSAFPLEAHLVHRDAGGNLAVLAVMLIKGQPNPLIETLWRSMPREPGKDETVTSDTINAMALLPADRSYFRYNGSLTTPPCSEGVRWMVLRTPVQVSAAQVELFLSTIQENARPVQPINARVILK
jgi:carbonic anhydrase